MKKQILILVAGLALGASGFWHGLEAMELRSGKAGKHPLHEAVRADDLVRVRKLLAARDAEGKQRFDVNAQDEVGRTPLHWATLGERWEIIGELMKNSTVSVDIPDNDGYSSYDYCKRILHAVVISR